MKLQEKTVKELKSTPPIKAYMQYKMIKKIPESIPQDYRKGEKEGCRGKDEVDDVGVKMLTKGVFD